MYPSSHYIETNEQEVTLFSSNGKELLTLTNPKWNGLGNLLTYMVRVYISKLMLKNNFNPNNY
jgi:hypothetical protein